MKLSLGRPRWDVDTAQRRLPENPPVQVGTTYLPNVQLSTPREHLNTPVLCRFRSVP